MSDLLEEMWRRQSVQQRNWYDLSALPPEQRDRVLGQLINDSWSEMGELQKLLDLDRYHVLRRHNPAPEEIAEAGVDVVKLLIAILQLHGISFTAFFDVFMRKSDVVDDKWRQAQSQLSSGERVLAVDLDGCAADWVEGFLAFCAAAGRPISSSEVNNPNFEGLKDEFHRSGGFLNLKPYPGAIEAIRRIRAKHTAKVVIITARPYKQVKRVYPDTMEWCKAKGLEYDHIIFNRDKAEAIASLAPATVLALVEDRAKHALEVAIAGVKVLKLPSYGGEKVEHPNIIPVADWGAIERELEMR